jgi:flavin-dependent dehydrogenase
MFPHSRTRDENVVAVDAAIIGGGPAGSVAARLLASWGHRVLVVARKSPASRALAESLPPSCRPVLAETGMLAAVHAAGFVRTTGNTVWWGDRDGQHESFGGEGAPGYQVFRPDFDSLLLTEAQRADAGVWHDATVQHVSLEDTQARLQIACGDSQIRTVDATFALDCSGRTGVVARQGFRRQHAGFRGQALIGVWHRPDGWVLTDTTDTLVETYDGGWGWSVPVSHTVRHVGLMVDAATGRIARGRTFDETYVAELRRVRQLGRLVDGAALQRAWACDASVYRSTHYAGENFLLVGDAATFIEPLSSFGVKKALMSAWVAAVAVHTCLEHPDRRVVAQDFFARWEQQVFDTSLRRSSEYAREAHARHQHPFWAARAAADVAPAFEPLDEEALIRAPDVIEAFHVIRESPTFDFTERGLVPLAQRPVIRNLTIALEDALDLPGIVHGLRFLKGVDLVSLRDVACRHRQVGDLFDAYCRTHGHVPLPHVLAGLSLLVARGALTRTATTA